MNVSDYRISEENDDEGYKTECSKALSYVEELVFKTRVDAYEFEREAYYLKPKEKIELWKQAGEPIIAEEYGDIIVALRQLGRATEAQVLCDRAIGELSELANCYALYMKGCYLLHSYDVSGIDYIYKSIESNSNYIDEGLNIIGDFCCLTGRQDELDTYRARAIELGQASKDKYSKLSVLSKKDKLTSEKLPENLLNNILEYIHSVGNEEIQEIFLVRKTISKDFFTSVFVIHFEEATGLDAQDEIMHKIFCYLDTCSDWQFSLFNYTDVIPVKIYTIKNSCVFSKK